MLQKYTLKGLHCAHCGAKIEQEVQKWTTVEHAMLNLTTNTIFIETNTDEKTMQQQLQALVEKIEPGVEVVSPKVEGVSAAHSCTEGASCHCHKEAANHQFILEGLQCAHCASLIEEEIKSWQDVSEVSLNLVTTTLALTSATQKEVLLARIRDCVSSIEPGVTVCEKNGSQKQKVQTPSTKKLALPSLFEGQTQQWLPFGIAFALFVLGLVGVLGVWGSIGALLLSYLIVGLPVIDKAFKSARGGFIFNENLLMTVASLGAWAIGERAEGVAVMLFYTLGELLQEMAVARSKRSIASLLDLRPEKVRLQKDDGFVEVAPEMAEVGQIMQVQPGERLALDGVVVEGSASLDTSAVTGESRPFDVGVGDEVKGGSVNKDGVLLIRVSKVYQDSTLARILSLVEEAGARKAHTEKFISRFAHYYTPVVVGLALLVAVVPPIFTDGSWSTWFYRGLVFLVVSCPCALVLSVPLTYFAGIGGASRQHILVKGSQYLETLADVTDIAFDKTGTLTQGEFSVVDVVSMANWSKDDVIQVAAMLEQYASHPIGKAIVRAAGDVLDAPVADYKNIAGEGVVAMIEGEAYYLGNARLLKNHDIVFDEALVPEGTVVLLANSQQLLGMILLEDSEKPGVSEAIRGLHALGIEKVTILSGDTPVVAEKIAHKLGMDGAVGGLLPEDKLQCLEEMMEVGKGTIAFVGDGINDAPVLARADVGIAMGGVGSDAAIEAADVVLMSDHPADVVKAVKMAKKTRHIALENIVGALFFKVLLLTLAVFGMVNMWLAVFADVGVAILAVLNALRAMTYKEDE